MMPHLPQSNVPRINMPRQQPVQSFNTKLEAPNRVPFIVPEVPIQQASLNVKPNPINPQYDSSKSNEMSSYISSKSERSDPRCSIQNTVTCGLLN